MNLPGVDVLPKSLQAHVINSSRRSQKNPEKHLKNFRPPLSPFMGSVHDTTVLNKLGKNGMGEKTMLTKKNPKAHLPKTLGKYSVG